MLAVYMLESVGSFARRAAFMELPAWMHGETSIQNACLAVPFANAVCVSVQPDAGLLHIARARLLWQ